MVKPVEYRLVRQVGIFYDLSIICGLFGHPALQLNQQSCVLQKNYLNLNRGSSDPAEIVPAQLRQTSPAICLRRRLTDSALLIRLRVAPDTESEQHNQRDDASEHLIFHKTNSLDRSRKLTNRLGVRLIHLDRHGTH